MTTDQGKRMIRRQTPERLIELARGIVRGELLIADETKDWVHSLFMMGEEISRTRNLGLVLVPVDPHLGGYWLNGTVPAMTITCTLVAKGDLPALQNHVSTMMDALWPDPSPNA